MARLAQRVGDRRLLVLIGRLLKAKVVLPDGVVIGVDEGVPQGSPLSPLLSNIVLDELDQELARRGHRFVRYADDCNVYVRSERAGQRVMASLERFIAVALAPADQPRQVGRRPTGGPALPRLLPAASSRRTGSVVVLLPQRTKRNAMARIRELTPRTWGGTLDSCIHRINAWLRGWHRVLRDRLGLRGAASCARSTPTSGGGCARSCCKHWKRPSARSLGASSRWASSRSSAWGRSTPEEVDVGPQPRSGRRSRPAQRVLRRARADLDGRLHRDRRPSHHRPCPSNMALELG